MSPFKRLPVATAMALLLCRCSAQPRALQYQLVHTDAGTEYGVDAGNLGQPLALIFTTNISSSLDGTFTPIGRTLARAGYTVAAVDVTCHGKDLRAGELEGLGCWALRVQQTGADIFEPMRQRASDAITDLTNKGIISGKEVIAVGVSRGGYAALRLAAVDARVTSLVLMSPVTSLSKLSEFRGVATLPEIYALAKDYRTYADKRIFLQIGISDERVGTAEAEAFVQGVIAAGRGNPVDLTMFVTPQPGHSSPVDQHQLAAQWAMHFANTSSNTLAAP